MACPIDKPTLGRNDRRGRQSRARWTQAEIIILEAKESRYLTRSGLRGGLRRNVEHRWGVHRAVGKLSEVALPVTQERCEFVGCESCVKLANYKTLFAT
jgi:hypothetical protein